MWQRHTIDGPAAAQRRARGPPSAGRAARPRRRGARRRPARRVLAQHALVEPALGRPERPSVARVRVEPVVEPLGEGEELGRPRDDHPAGVGAGVTGIPDQRSHHLGDAAAASRRVHVPHHPAAQGLDGGADLGAPRLVGAGIHQLRESGERLRRHPHLHRPERTGSRPHAPSARRRMPRSIRRSIANPIGSISAGPIARRVRRSSEPADR